MISECFPPNSATMRFHSPVHDLLDSHSYSLDENSLTFDFEITEDDLEEVKNLHNEWFPIKYHDGFYTSLLAKKVGIILVKANVTLHALKMNDQIGEEYPQTKRIILGLLTFQMKASKSRYTTWTQKLQSVFYDFHGYEILTLGVLFEFRKLHLGSAMLNKLILYAKIDKKEFNIIFFKLHVIEHNYSGLKFYEKNGFKVLKVRKDYYTIEGQKYNCVKLIKYI